MALLGNWKVEQNQNIIQTWGRLAIIARDGAILEISVDDSADQWEQIHEFPATTGEVYPINLPTDTRLRVSGGGQWAWAEFKKGN